MSFASSIIAWYCSHARVLPWRTNPPDPYKIWVSEIMLQQTTVQTVIPYFERFIEHFPNVDTLASAPLEEVLWFWQGLGYYRRAKYLHQGARLVQNIGIPRTEEEWLVIPGVGSYTAAAITAIAYGLRAVALDGNIYRILSRYARLNGPGWKKHAAKIASTLLSKDASSEGGLLDYSAYTQGLMDLGARICRPRQPLCLQCPVNTLCQSFQHQQTHLYPERVSRAKEQRFAHVIVWHQDGKVAITQSFPHTLLKGLWGFPMVHWGTELVPVSWSLAHAGSVQHIFTHLKVHLDVWIRHDTHQITQEHIKILDQKECCAMHDFLRTHTTEPFLPEHLDWIAPTDLSVYPFSRWMRKVQECAGL